MKLKLTLIVAATLLLLAQETSARRQMKGGKAHKGVAHHRSKRTIGDIINWKLGLLQNIFDGITGFFGGGGSNAPSSSYGAPSSSYGTPQKPSYNGGGGQKPSYNGGGGQKPSYNRPNSGGNSKGSGFKLPKLPLKGLFDVFKGGNKGNNGGGYNAPARPSYNAPSQGYGSPNQGQQQQQGGYNSGNQNFAAPSQGYNSGGNQQGYNGGNNQPQGPPRTPNPNDFGPSNAIKMLPAPDLSNVQPPAGFNGGNSGYNSGGGNNNNNFNNGGGSGFNNGGQQALDSYGAPEADPIDSYGAPQADPIDSYGAPQADPVSDIDSYGAPQADPIDSYGAPQADPIAAPAADDYGAPQAAPIAAPQAAPIAAPAEDSYGSPDAAPISAPNQAADNYGSPQGPPVGAPSQYRDAKQLPDSYNDAQDSYGAAQADPINNSVAASQSAPDSYGSPTSPLLAPDNAASPATSSNSAAAAPVSAPDSYGSPVTGVLAPTGSGAAPATVDDVDLRNDNSEAVIQSTLQQANFLPSSFEEVAPRNPGASSGIADPDPVDVYGSALAPVGTSAPVPEEIFTQDSSEPTSFDSYGAAQDSGVTPGISRVVDVKIQDPEYIENTESLSEEVTPAPGPILFTYAPSTEKETKALADPLNVIPDDYEYSNYDSGYDEYDPKDIPADQAADPLPGYGADDDLSGYGAGGNDLDSYGDNSIDNYGGEPDVSKSIPSLTTPAQEITGFTDLRSLQFTTAAPLEIEVDDEEYTEEDEPEITTYSPPIDFKLGTTASDGIEAGDIQYDNDLEPDFDAPVPDVYDNDYEEPETSYNPDVNIPLQVEIDEQSAELPNYNEPPLLLLGTPDQDIELDSYTQADALRAKVSRKRSPDPKYIKQKYNNWLNRANDWSQKISSRIENRNSVHNNARTYFYN